MLNIQFVQLLVGMVLIYAAIKDLQDFKIPNSSIIVLVILFIVFSLLKGALWPTIWHVVFALVMFALILSAYASKLLGGGDAKLLSVAFLWMGLENTALFCLLLAAAAAIYYVLALLVKILPRKPNETGRTLIPYGPCIAAAWIATAALRIHS